MTRRRSHAPRRPGIFRRRMILQLTSLLDLLLIIVFVQYLEMRQVSAQLIADAKNRQAQAAATTCAKSGGFTSMDIARSIPMARSWSARRRRKKSSSRATPTTLCGNWSMR